MRTFAVKTFVFAAFLGVSAVGAFPGKVLAQASSSVAPMVIPVSGQFPGRTGIAVVQVSLYDGQNDQAPRWVESHTVTLNEQGGYTIQFGSASDQAALQSMFVDAPGARWLGVAIENEPEAPNSRVMLVSVPYAAKAASAETLGGKSASDFMLSSTFREDLQKVLQEEGVTNDEGDVGSEAVTLNYLQKGDGAGGTTDSTVFEAPSGNVGIGTITPQDRLDVFGGLRLSGLVADTRIRIRPEGTQRAIIGMAGAIKGTSSTDLALFAETGSGLSVMVNGSPVDALTLTAGGNVGVGVTAPQDRLDISGGLRLSGVPGDTRIRFRPGGTQRAIIGLSGAIKGNSTTDLAFFAESGSGISLMVNGSPTDAFTLTSTGNVGIGTASPSAKLHVAGSATVSGNMVVDGNIGAKYQDVAEWVDAAEPLEPGTVVIIDVTARNRVRASTTSYDTRVAGAISPQPGLILGEPGEGRVLVAQSGRVRVKADTRNGAIKPGDLLVTSPRAGYAMKAKSAKPGTVLGKALEPLDKGTGDILVLLTLQ